MPKNLLFQRLNKHPKHRYSMLRNMAASLFLHERITTTQGKAKILVPFVNRIFSKSQKNLLVHKNKVLGLVRVKGANYKLYRDIRIRFGSTSGTITTMTPLFKRRRGDNSKMAVVELLKK